jgi:alkanesulfonate monooxygenase SsuD/methylene tetrahydromethanopterin reductase-like flavin-dependent oxidoreductase (luciferase family)
MERGTAMSIRIGYLLPTRERIMAGQPEAAPLLELAERAERLSFDSVWAGAPAKSPTSKRH